MHLTISNASEEPIYQQILTQIKTLIIQGEMSGGEALPSIRALAKDLQISVITTKRAYEELEREGFIDTVPGKGSFVAVQNRELLREQRLRVVEEKLALAVNLARSAGIGLSELQEILSLIYEEED
ncbi:GntR family transcriptional regulator [Acididesulfobacillus acetoxydans]|nr:GntR family transcriptional regulator [Acididesulfobacillus acetoxydans]